MTARVLQKAHLSRQSMSPRQKRLTEHCIITFGLVKLSRYMAIVNRFHALNEGREGASKSSHI